MKECYSKVKVYKMEQEVKKHLKVPEGGEKTGRAGNVSGDIRRFGVWTLIR